MYWLWNLLDLKKKVQQIYTQSENVYSNHNSSYCFSIIYFDSFHFYFYKNQLRCDCYFKFLDLGNLTYDLCKCVAFYWLQSIHNVYFIYMIMM